MTMRPRLKDTINNPRYNGIFIELFNLNYFEWLTRKFAVNTNYEYYTLHSGDKKVSKILLPSEFKSRITTEQYPNSFVVTRTDRHYIITENNIDNLKNAAQIIISKFGDKWNRIYDLLVEEQYNPIHNYNMTEVIKRDLSTGSTRKQKSNISNTVNNNNWTVGFNTEDSSDTDGSTTRTVLIGNLDDNQIISNGTDEETITTEKSGNIGVTTTQKMLADELDIRLKDIFNNIIFKDVDSILCLSVY